MNEQLLQKVETLYGIKILSTHNIRDVYQLTTDQGELCLKKINYNTNKFLFIYYAMEHLLKQGFTQLPAFMHTLSGEPYFTYDGQNYFLSEWLNGREADFKNLVDLEMAVVTLARLHRFSKGFVLPLKVKVKSRLGIWPERLKKRTADLKKFKELAENKKNPSRVDKYYLKHVDKKIDECMQAINFIDTPEYQQLVNEVKKDGSFCHNDFVYHNVLIDDTGERAKEPKAYIIDFDYCRHDLRVYDLARLIRRVVKDKKEQKDLLDIILSAYNSEYPLRYNEYQILAGFLQFPQRFWRVADRYFNQKKDWSTKKFYSHMKRSVRRFRHRKSLIKELLNYGQKDN